MTTIQQGENFLLSMILKNDDGSDVMVASLQSFTINAKSADKLIKAWEWIPANAGDPHIVIVDGLAKLEVDSSLTKTWIRKIVFEILPSFIDTDYFISGAQTDVVCFHDLLTVEQC